MRSTATRFEDLRLALADVKVIDCHEHITRREKVTDILAWLASSYLESDLTSVVGQVAVRTIQDKNLPIDQRWPIFEKAWNAVRFTGYGLGARVALKRVFGEQEPTQERVNQWQAALPDYSDPQQFDPLLKDAGIAASISDNWPGTKEIWDGTFKALPWQHLAISLPGLHAITRRDELNGLEEATGVTVTSLDEYIDLCGRLFEKWLAIGAVCMKDQSAYTRSLEYGMPAKAEAESIFNKMLSDPRFAAQYDPHDNPLSDYLMHAFMRLARDMNLPVQLHTGHMAGIRNSVAKANAKGLRSLLEIHRDVRFDLFHANWPYAGDLLFLAKNYPNVSIDMCWAYAIDPNYGKEFLKQSVSTVGYTKIHGFGSDVGGDQPHLVWAYSQVARDVIAAALAELVDEHYLGLADAEAIGKAWLFDNPSRFFGVPTE